MQLEPSSSCTGTSHLRPRAPATCRTSCVPARSFRPGPLGRRRVQLECHSLRASANSSPPSPFIPRPATSHHHVPSPCATSCARRRPQRRLRSFEAWAVSCLLRRGRSRSVWMSRLSKPTRMAGLLPGRRRLRRAESSENAVVVESRLLPGRRRLRRIVRERGCG